MIESGIFLATVENKKLKVKKDLVEIFYGSGGPDSKATPNARLMRWEVKDSEEKMDSFSFTLENGDMSLFDSPYFAMGNTVMFQFGYPGNLAGPFKGVITNRTGWRTLQIHGEFASEIKIATGVASEKFVKKKLSDIAKELFAREGLKAVVDDTKLVLDVVIKRDETTLQFLKRKAKECGSTWQVYVEGDTGYWVKKQLDKAPGFTLKFATEANDSEYVTLEDPEFRHEQSNTSTQETVKGFDMLNGKSIKAKADIKTSTQPTLGTGSYYFDEAAGTRKLKPATARKTEDTGQSKTTARQTPSEAKNVAGSEFDLKFAKAFNLRWRIIGDRKSVV